MDYLINQCFIQSTNPSSHIVLCILKLRIFHAINNVSFVYLLCNEDVMAENDISLKQRNARGLDISIKLFDGRELQVVSKLKKSQKSYSVDILSLQDKSKQSIFIAWKWLVISIIFIAVTLSLLKILPAYLGDNKNLYLGIILFSGFLGVLLSWIQFWKCSVIKQIFMSQNAGVPIIELIVNKPSKEQFLSFIDYVEHRIKEYRLHMNIAEDKQLIGEMKMLRRLSDTGVISKKSYESAKSKLFSGFDSQVINRDE